MTENTENAATDITTLVYRGVKVEITAEALAELQAKVGLSKTNVFDEIKSGLDWSLENDDQTPEDITITEDDKK